MCENDIISTNGDVLCCYTVVPSAMQIWIDDDDVLQFKLGVDRDELLFMWDLCKDSLINHYREKHHQHNPKLLPFACLLMTLYYLRHYPSLRCLAAELGVGRTVISEYIDHTIQCLYNTIVPACFGDSTLPHRCFQEGVITNVRFIIDSTFIILPHHSVKEESKKFYHLKSPTRQALKWQLTTTTDGIPYHISDVFYGSKADITILRESGVLKNFGDDTRALGDKGYLGEREIITPKKKPKGGEITAEEKKDNKLIHSKRVVVENCFHQFKRWMIVGGEYHGAINNILDLQHVKHIVHVVGALVKRYLMKHPLRRDPTATSSHSS